MLSISDGHSEPIVHMAWAADDWSQPVFEPVHGMDEFERFAESRKEEPLDTVRALLVSPNEVYSEFADFDQGWLSTIKVSGPRGGGGVGWLGR